MRKLTGIVLTLSLILSLFVGGTVLAADPEEGTINVNMEGGNYSFTVATLSNDVQDFFAGEAHSSLDAHQTVRYQPSGQWTYDAPDIDRYAEFYGDGYIVAHSNYDSSAQWSWAESEMYGYVESDTYGSLGQNTHFDSGWGGVKDVDPWKKQRNMDIDASGDYLIATGGQDLRGAPDYGFNFVAADSSSSGHLHVNTLATATEHGSGQWYTPDRLIVDFVFNYDGSPGVAVDYLAETGGSIDTTIDLVNEFVSGSGTIW